MKNGILGQTAPAEKPVQTAELSIEAIIAADEAIMEASELAHEAEVAYADMEQGMAVAAHMETQAQISGEAMAQPELVNVATVALARESMSMALTALGGAHTDFHVSTESMQDSPVQAMDVTHEGIKDVATKIYEGIKMVFKKIALAAKKLAAKVVVITDTTSSKAEKLLESFKANDKAVPVAKVDEDVALTLVTKNAGLNYLMDEKFGSGAFGVLDAAAANINAMRVVGSESLDDIAALDKALEAEAGSEEAYTALKEGTFRSVKYALAAKIAGGGSVVKDQIAVSGAKELKLTAEQVKSLELPSETIESTVVFYPTYVKGNTIRGVLLRAEELSSDDLKDAASIVASIKQHNVSVKARSTSELESMAKSYKLADRKLVENILLTLKGASKAVKAFSDARLKDVDAAMKEIDTAAKKAPGNSILNRFAGSEFNNTRMFIAGTHVSSIFAASSMFSNQLKEASLIIAQYETPSK